MLVFPVARKTVQKHPATGVDCRTQSVEYLAVQQQALERPVEVFGSRVLVIERLRFHASDIIFQQDRSGPIVGALFHVAFAAFPTEIAQDVAVIVHGGVALVPHELVDLHLPEEFIDDRKRQFDVFGDISSRRIADAQEIFQDESFDVGIGKPRFFERFRFHRKEGIFTPLLLGNAGRRQGRWSRLSDALIGRRRLGFRGVILLLVRFVDFHVEVLERLNPLGELLEMGVDIIHIAGNFRILLRREFLGGGLLRGGSLFLGPLILGRSGLGVLPLLQVFRRLQSQGRFLFDRFVLFGKKSHRSYLLLSVV